MFSWRSHPDPGQLLRFSEGELPAREASGIEHHILGCWECRTHVDEMRGVIGDYVRYRTDVLRPSIPEPPAPWKGLSNEFRRIRNEEKGGRHLTIFRRSLAWTAAGITVLAAAAATVVLIHPDLHPVTPRSEIHERKPSKPIEYRASQLPPKRRDSFPKKSAIQEERVGPDDELRVIAALHRVGADLGDPIEVTRQSEKIIIHGAGLEPERIAQLRVSLGNIPHVSFDFATPAPLAADASPVVVESGRSSPVQAQIARQFTDHAAFQKFADQTLEASERMLARAHALRGLADRFPPNVESQMSAKSVALLAAIRTEHLAALASAVEGIDLSVTPLLKSLHTDANSPPVLHPMNWQELAGSLLSTAERMDQVIGTMLATTTGSSVAGLAAPTLGAASSPSAVDSGRSVAGLSASALETQLVDALSDIKKDIATLQRVSQDGQMRRDR